MRKDKKLRVVSLIALSISVLGLTLGFAAFSNTLTISSSASVSPDSSDFKLVFYGVEDATKFDEYGDFDTEVTSLVKSEPLVGGRATATTAVIDNEALTIKNMNVAYVEPGDDANYYFLVKNEGKYPVYITHEDFMEFANNFVNKTCVAKEGTTDSLVQEACRNINGYVLFDDHVNGHHFDSQFPHGDSDYMEIPVGGSADLIIWLSYFDSLLPRADGDFEVIYDDAKLTYSTVKPVE